MAKFFGKVGFVETVQSEDSFSVYKEKVTERSYYGDITKNSRRLENGESLNDNLVLSASFSIVADAYAYQNYSAIRYVEWMGAKWRVTYVEVDRPRLILNAGGVYNAPEN